MRITLRPEWACDPLWIAHGDTTPEPYAPDDVPGLSQDLRAAITTWDDTFQSTLDHNYPPDSAFPTPEAEATWLQQGKHLARRLQAELPHAEITYGTFAGRTLPLD